MSDLFRTRRVPRLVFREWLIVLLILLVGWVFFSRLPRGKVWWWAPLLMFGWIIMAVASMVWSRRWGRPKYPPDCCQNCGYNLTGNVSGICPECGTPVPPDAAPAPNKP